MYQIRSTAERAWLRRANIALGRLICTRFALDIGETRNLTRRRRWGRGRYFWFSGFRCRAKVKRIFTWRPKAESGLGCLICTIFVNSKPYTRDGEGGGGDGHGVSSSSLLLPSLELRDTKVYEPYIRALLGTASHVWHGVFESGGVFVNPTAVERIRHT